MNNHEYIIPTSRFVPENDQASVVEPQNSIQERDLLMENYLQQIEAKEYAKRRMEKSSIIRGYASLIETARGQHLEDIEQQNRSARLGRIISYVTLGKTISRQDTQSLWNRLVEREANLGGSLLDTPQTQKHSYHYHDNHEWFWYAEDLLSGKKQSVRFKIDINDVYKSIEGSNFVSLDDQELDNLLTVSEHYLKHVVTNVYSRTDLLQA